jgi:hypothetical protein
MASITISINLTGRTSDTLGTLQVLKSSSQTMLHVRIKSSINRMVVGVVGLLSGNERPLTVFYFLIISLSIAFVVFVRIINNAFPNRQQLCSSRRSLHIIILYAFRIIASQFEYGVIFWKARKETAASYYIRTYVTGRTVSRSGEL